MEYLGYVTNSKLVLAPAQGPYAVSCDSIIRICDVLYFDPASLRALSNSFAKSNFRFNDPEGHRANAELAIQIKKTIKKRKTQVE